MITYDNQCNMFSTFNRILLHFQLHTVRCIKMPQAWRLGALLFQAPLQLSGHILQASGCRMLPLAIGIHWVSLVSVCQPLISLIEFCWKIVENYWAYDIVWFHDLVEGENHALFKPILGLGITVFWCLVRTKERWEEVKHLHKCPLDFAADTGNLRRNSEKQLWTPAVAAEESIKLRQGSKVKLNIIITYQ